MATHKLEFFCFYDHSEKELIIDIIGDELKSLVRLMPTEVNVEHAGTIHTRRIFEVYVPALAQGSTTKKANYSINFKQRDNVSTRHFSLVRRTRPLNASEPANGVRWPARDTEGKLKAWDGDAGYDTPIDTYHGGSYQVPSVLDFYVDFAPDDELARSYGYQLNLLSLGAAFQGKRKPPIIDFPEGGDDDNGHDNPGLPIGAWPDPTTDASPSAPAPTSDPRPDNVASRPTHEGITVNITTANITVYSSAAGTDL